MQEVQEKWYVVPAYLRCMNYQWETKPEEQSNFFITTTRTTASLIILHYKIFVQNTYWIGISSHNLFLVNKINSDAEEKDIFVLGF